MVKKIDFYVDVIDNYWDLWFAINLLFIMLKNDLELEVRLFSNDEKLFKNMTQNNDNTKRVFYYDLSEINYFEPNKLIFNFFDRKIDFDFLKSKKYEIKLVNFTYFLMHKWVENLHLTSYSDKNINIVHFVPSLLENTGWILINKSETNYLKNDFIEYLNNKYSLNINLKFDKKYISIFVYKDTLNELLINLNQDKNIYFIFWYPDLDIKNDNIIVMPFIELQDYNNFLNICDINFVRGENSLISSLICWKPTLWDIYKEKNNAHIEKISDFINFLEKFGFEKDYFDLFIWFNMSNKFIFFDKFTNDFLDYNSKFQTISKYIINNCDAYEKIKKILN